jgi:hypothetical protein
MRFSRALSASTARGGGGDGGPDDARAEAEARAAAARTLAAEREMERMSSWDSITASPGGLRSVIPIFLGGGSRILHLIHHSHYFSSMYLIEDWVGGG